MALSLYELHHQYQQVLEFEVENEEDAKAMIELLDEASDSVEVKIAKIGHVMKTLDYEMEALAAEEKALAAKRKARENKRERLGQYCYQAMKSLGLTKIEQIDRVVSIQKNPPSLRIVDENAVPAEWWVPQDPKLDVAGLKAWVKEHEDECDFAFLEQGESLRVR
jgi:hypothetical protein